MQNKPKKVKKETKKSEKIPKMWDFVANKAAFWGAKVGDLWHDGISRFLEILTQVSNAIPSGFISSPFSTAFQGIKGALFFVFGPFYLILMTEDFRKSVDMIMKEWQGEWVFDKVEDLTKSKYRLTEKELKKVRKRWAILRLVLFVSRVSLAFIAIGCVVAGVILTVSAIIFPPAAATLLLTAGIIGATSTALMIIAGCIDLLQKGIDHRRKQGVDAEFVVRLGIVGGGSILLGVVSLGIAIAGLVFAGPIVLWIAAGFGGVMLIFSSVVLGLSVYEKLKSPPTPGEGYEDYIEKSLDIEKLNNETPALNKLSLNDVKQVLKDLNKDLKNKDLKNKDLNKDLNKEKKKEETKKEKEAKEEEKKEEKKSELPKEEQVKITEKESKDLTWGLQYSFTNEDKINVEKTEKGQFIVRGERPEVVDFLQRLKDKDYIPKNIQLPPKEVVGLHKWIKSAIGKLKEGLQNKSTLSQ